MMSTCPIGEWYFYDQISGEEHESDIETLSRITRPLEIEWISEWGEKRGSVYRPVLSSVLRENDLNEAPTIPLQDAKIIMEAFSTAGMDIERISTTEKSTIIPCFLTLEKAKKRNEVLLKIRNFLPDDVLLFDYEEIMDATLRDVIEGTSSHTAKKMIKETKRVRVAFADFLNQLGLSWEIKTSNDKSSAEISVVKNLNTDSRALAAEFQVVSVLLAQHGIETSASKYIRPLGENLVGGFHNYLDPFVPYLHFTMREAGTVRQRLNGMTSKLKQRFTCSRE